MTLQEFAQIAQIVSTACVIASAITAITVLLYTRRTNRRRATLDMVMKTFIEPSGREMYDKFIALTRRAELDDSIDDFQFIKLEPFSHALASEHATVLDQMNTYELVSLGIRNSVFDEAFFKRWYQAQFQRDYKSLEPLIQLIQNEKSTFFCEFTWLYKRWVKHKHPDEKVPVYKKMWWILRGQDAKLKAAL